MVAGCVDGVFFMPGVDGSACHHPLGDKNWDGGGVRLGK